MSATNMNKPLLVKSSPISTERWSGMTCTSSCEMRPMQKCLTMEPVPDYKLPYRSWYSLIAHATPGVVVQSWKLWRQRSRASGQ